MRNTPRPRWLAQAEPKIGRCAMLDLTKEQLDALESLPDRSTIVPRIKHTNYLKAVKEAGAAPHEYPVTQPFVADLMITYAFDMPGLFPAVSAHDLRELALTQDELHEIAMANLRRQ